MLLTLIIKVDFFKKNDGRDVLAKISKGAVLTV